jgi:hypothetical protein
MTKMVDITTMLEYLIARRVGDTDVIDAAPNDPILLQAQADGFADWRGDQWIGRGYIQTGERRIVRHWCGGTTEVIGD